MKLKTDTWKVQLVVQTWGRYPRSLCSFFYALAGAILILPWSWVLLLMERSHHTSMDAEGKAWMGLLAIPLWLLFFSSGLENLEYQTVPEWFWWSLLVCTPLTLVALVLLVAVAALIIGVPLGCYEWICDRIRKQQAQASLAPQAAEESPSIVLGYLKAIRDKVCPLIEYEEPTQHPSP